MKGLGRVVKILSRTVSVMLVEVEASFKEHHLAGQWAISAHRVYPGRMTFSKGAVRPGFVCWFLSLKLRRSFCMVSRVYHNFRG